MTLLRSTQRGPAALTGGLLVALTLAGTQTSATAQGCVAVRGSSMCMLPHDHSSSPNDANLMAGNWLASVSYRWLRSDRHFSGDTESRNAAGLTRKQQGNPIVNNSDFIDLGLQYAFSPRYSASFTLPLVVSTRSQVAPATAKNPDGSPYVGRFETHASGLGDARLTGYAWLWDPTKMPKGNLQVGLGLKVPSGQDDASDTFQTSAGPTVRHVDQSIQPGDGGWGFSLEANAYREILPRTEAFLQLSYLFNPEDTNGVQTGRYNADPKAAGHYEDVMSIADQYFARGGLSYTLVPKWGLSISLAGRVEGIPVEDLLGASHGFRRPGFAISIDPGIQLMKGRYAFNLNIPVSVIRNRERSLADQQAAALKGSDVHGDAAFADYVVTASFSVRF